MERLELGVRSAAGAHEIRVIRVRETVRVGARGGEHRLLLERKNEVDGADRDENVRDRVGPLGVGSRVRAPLLDAELAAEASCERGEKASAVAFRRPNLEVRASGAAERARAEKRAAEVGGGAAMPSDNAVGRAA